MSILKIIPEFKQKGFAQLFIILILFAGFIALLFLIRKPQTLRPKAAADLPNSSKNILLNQAEAPINNSGDRIVLKSEKEGVNRNPHYSVEYLPSSDLFILAVNDAPVEQVRAEAEKNLLQKAGNDLQSLCKLQFNIIANKDITDDGYFASDNTLGICKEFKTQLSNPPTEDFTPSLSDTIQSIGSAITQDGGKAFLSNKPIVASEDLPQNVYITLCRNDGTNAEGVWQVGRNLQAANITTYANQENARCNWPIPNYLVFTQDVPVGAYLTLCETEDGSQTPKESFWQVDNSGKVADYRGVKDGCSEVPPLPKPVITARIQSYSYPVSASKCSPLHDNSLCSVENLTKYFGSNAEKASIICFGESGGNPTQLNENCKTNDYSVGLFQINLVGSCSGAYGAGRWGVQSCDNLLSIEKRNVCEQQWRNDREANIQKAVSMSGGGTKWSHAWGAAKACGIN